MIVAPGADMGLAKASYWQLRARPIPRMSRAGGMAIMASRKPSQRQKAMALRVFLMVIEQAP